MQHQVAVAAYSILYLTILQKALHCNASYDCLAVIQTVHTQSLPGLRYCHDMNNVLQMQTDLMGGSHCGNIDCSLT